MNVADTNRQANLQRHMVRGSIWSIGGRWSLRLMGLVSTIVLARLLTPADYGIVAIATMIVGTVEIFSRVGQDSAIIRHPNPSREHYDSAWTVYLLLGLGLGAIIWLLSPLAVTYFHEPRAGTVVQILGVRTMLSGSQNIGVVNFRRNLQFRKQYAFNVIPSIVSFGVTIAAAIILRNYWALVIGIMSEYVVTLILSYTMEPFRPRFCISKVAEIWSFSIWSLWLNLGRYLNDLLDRVSIGGFAGAAEMGRYYVATDVAGAPTQELVAPMVSVLLPVMSKAQNDRAQLRTLYLAVLYWSALMSASTSIGVALVTDDLVDFALGPQWQDAKSLLPWLALSFGTLGMAASVYTTLTTIGLVRFAARLQWTRLCMMALAIVPMAFFYKDVDYIAKTRFVLTVLVTPMLFYALMKPLELTLKDVAVTLWRPLAAGAVMAIAVLGLNAVLPFAGTGRLFLDAATGALTYALTLMLLWLAVGRPDGPERKVWNVLGAQLARWRM